MLTHTQNTNLSSAQQGVGPVVDPRESCAQNEQQPHLTKRRLLQNGFRTPLFGGCGATIRTYPKWTLVNGTKDKTCSPLVAELLTRTYLEGTDGKPKRFGWETEENRKAMLGHDFEKLGDDFEKPSPGFLDLLAYALIIAGKPPNKQKLNPRSTDCRKPLIPCTPKGAGDPQRQCGSLDPWVCLSWDPSAQKRAGFPLRAVDPGSVRDACR